MQSIKMESAEDIINNIKEVFKSAQETAAAHQKGIFTLVKIYEKVDEQIFFQGLRNSLIHILQTDYKQKNVYIDRLMEFVATFSASLKKRQIETDSEEDFVEHPIVIKIFEFLLKTQRLKSDIVRFRSCQLINKILDQLKDREVSYELCEHIEEALLERLKDPKSIVREQAIISLNRLQDPTDSEDVITSEFIHIIKCDIHAKIREMAVKKIAIRKDVIPEIVSKVTDTDVNVRLAAFKQLSKLAKSLKIVHKRLILKCGFLDPSPKVVEYMSELLLAWLAHYDNDIIQLLKAVRLDADENDIEETMVNFDFILGALFKLKSLNELTQVLPINEKKLVPIEQLNWEIVSYWRIYVQFLNHRDEFEDELEKVLPELVHFCQYVQQYIDSIPKNSKTTEFLVHQFVLSQLFLMTKTYDFADTISRQSLNALVSSTLEKEVLTADVVKVIVSNLELTIPNAENRSKFVTEIISEIMCPMESDLCQSVSLEMNYKISQLKVQINRLLEEQQQAIETQNYIDAERIKREIEVVQNTINDLKNVSEQPQQVERRTDIPTIVLVLDISIALLLSPNVIELTPALEALKADVIQDLLIHDHDNVRAKALECYALCCIIDSKCARNGIHIFSTPISAYYSGEECDTQTILICIRAVVDLLIIHSSKLMAEPEDLLEDIDEEHVKIFSGGTSLTDLVQGLVYLMDDEKIEIQETAGRGLCSLVVFRRVHSPALISRLILKWCSPALEESGKLKQMIGATLEKLPFMQDYTEQLEGAVLMTIKSLLRAPASSPLIDVDIENIAKFMLALCKTSQEGAHIHSNLAMSMCCEMKDKPRSKINFIYSKMLLMITVPEDNIIIRDLLKLCDQLRDEVYDRFAINNVIKFISILNKKENVDVPEIMVTKEEVIIIGENEEDLVFEQTETNNTANVSVYQ